MKSRRKPTTYDMSSGSDAENDFSSTTDFGSKGRFNSRDRQFGSNDSDQHSTKGRFGSGDKTRTNQGEQRISFTNERGRNVKSTLVFQDNKKDSLFQQNAQKNRMNSKEGNKSMQNLGKSMSPTKQNNNSLQQEQFKPPINEIIEEKPDSFLSKIQESLKDKLSCNLPTNELNKAKMKSEIAISHTEDRVTSFEKTVSITEDKIQQLQESMNNIVEKSQILDQTAQVVTQKLAALNEWTDNINRSQTTFLMIVIGWFVWIFSFSGSLLSIVWSGMRKSFNKNKNKANNVKEQTSGSVA